MAVGGVRDRCASSCSHEVGNFSWQTDVSFAQFTLAYIGRRDSDVILGRAEFKNSVRETNRCNPNNGRRIAGYDVARVMDPQIDPRQSDHPDEHESDGPDTRARTPSRRACG